MSFQPDHGHQGNVDEDFAQQLRPSDPRTLFTWGTTQSRKVSFYPPSAVEYLKLSTYFSSHFGASPPHRLRTRSRMCMGHSNLHAQSLYGTQKGRKPVETSVEVNC
ncbi:hypothetical protein TNIN_249401 [Trichonephila inaurata madagascariensis]|uniref:Uncharacterized protein n=1 Tax=Trichonephila inaurata madagascariensis TaxID=2747483 RepID=A0A8X6XGG1_9ARAC|nr:hypothetical protein TNIN_249401 [Trichonephila inaurata madagascariensis]